MEDGLHVAIDLRSDAIHVTGADESVARVVQIFSDFDALRKSGVNLYNGELNGMLKLVIADPAVTLRSLVDSGKQRSAGVKRMVQPRSPNQRKYVEAIEQCDMTFGIGPAGTGKTYLAVAMAVSALVAKKVSRIILVRPAVEAGERLGFLPGSLQEKVDPYLRPLYDALYDLLDPVKVDKLLESNLTQTDLPNPKKSGLLEALHVLDGVEGIRFCHFEDVDVVRHHLVQRIVRAYDSYGKAQQQLSLPIGDSVLPGAPMPPGEPSKVVPKPQ
jgi:phosphate starvation-inducible PhoH-like protein